MEKMIIEIKGFLPSGSVLPMSLARLVDKIHDKLNKYLKKDKEIKGEVIVGLVPSAYEGGLIIVNIDMDLNFPMELVGFSRLKQTILEEIRVLSKDRMVIFRKQVNAGFGLRTRKEEKIDTSFHDMD